MARSDNRYSIYPAPKAVEVVGNTSPALNQAIECWAALLVRAMADNTERICPWYLGDSDFSPDCQHILYEWCVLAEALQGKRFDPDFANPGDLLTAAVEDARRLEHVGDRWFRSEFDGEMHAAGYKSCFRELVEKLHKLDYAHAWAVIVAVQWFWEHQEQGIDLGKDPWWTLKFRSEWHQKRLGTKNTTATKAQKKDGRHRNQKRSPSSKV